MASRRARRSSVWGDDMARPGCRGRRAPDNPARRSPDRRRWQTPVMSTYFVVNATVTDPDQLAEYVAAAGATLDGHDVAVLAATNDAETIEGQPVGQRLVVLRFPDEAAFRAWYDSPAYQAIIGMRTASTTGFAVLAAGPRTTHGERRPGTMLPVIGRAVVVAAAVLGTSWSSTAPPAAAAECATSPTAAGLDAFFRADDAAGLAGADYPHAYALPDGRTLWLFQDAFVGADGQLGDDRFAHNAALVQSGRLLRAAADVGRDGTSWIGSWVECELSNGSGRSTPRSAPTATCGCSSPRSATPTAAGAASGAEPGRHVAGALPPARPRARRPRAGADASSALFGYSIVSDDDWTYLYGHCYKQYVRGRRRVRPVVLAVRLPGPGARGSSTARRSTGPAAGWTARARPAGRCSPASTRCRCRSSASATSTSRRPTRTTGSAPTSSIRTARGAAGSVDRGRCATRPRPAVATGATTTAPSSCPASRATRSSSPTRTTPGTCATTPSPTPRCTASACGPSTCPASRRPPPPVDEVDVADTPPVEAFAQRIVEPAVTELDGSLLETSPLDRSARWSDHVLRALRIAGLGLAATVALAATTGFATTARRAAPTRRRHALSGSHDGRHPRPRLAPATRRRMLCVSTNAGLPT